MTGSKSSSGTPSGKNKGWAGTCPLPTPVHPTATPQDVNMHVPSEENASLAARADQTVQVVIARLVGASKQASFQLVNTSRVSAVAAAAAAPCANFRTGTHDDARTALRDARHGTARRADVRYRATPITRRHQLIIASINDHQCSLPPPRQL